MFQLGTVEYIFFPSTHRTFSRIEYVGGHKIALKNIKSEIKLFFLFYINLICKCIQHVNFTVCTILHSIKPDDLICIHIHPTY